MEERPKLVPKLEPIDKILNFLGIVLLLFSWTYVAYYYPSLPELIPTHFDYKGNVDGHGKKITLFALPIIGTFIFAGLGTLNKAPHIFNYTVTITPENAERQYKISTRTLRYIKTIILLALAVIIFKTVGNAIGQEDGLGKWFLPAFLIITIATLGIMFSKAIKSK